MANGFLYVITSRCGNVKVGVSKSPSERLKQIQTSNVGAKLHFTSIEIGNAYDVESIVHEELGSFCVGGEWFSCNKIDAVSSVISNIDLYGITPKNIELNKAEFDAENKIQNWKVNGYSLELASMENHQIVEQYLKIDSSHEFSLLGHEQQYLIASTNLALAFINAHMTDIKEVN